MSTLKKVLRVGAIVSGSALLASVAIAVGIYFYLSPQLPSVDALRDVRFQVPLRVYTSDARLIAEFGESKRTPVKYRDVPPLLVKALISAEDDRFFEHPGVDYQGLMRAALVLLTTGEKAQGGSTITMQVARNFFLSREKTYLRKVTEILLSLKIEHELTKEEILELYLNKIYFGNRAYGVAAAAQVYYGKTLGELNLAEMAMIVGLPKAPSTHNPAVDPERARQRRDYVLGRMHSLGFIDDQAFEQARAVPVTARIYSQPIEVEAPYVAEMVRQEMVARYGEEEAYNSGYSIYTTLVGPQQVAANRGVRRGLMDYDRRHGYRGPVTTMPNLLSTTTDAWSDALRKIPTYGGMIPGLVVAVGEKSANAYLIDGQTVELGWEGMSWAKRYIDENQAGARPKSASEILQVGDIILLLQDDKGAWQLAQMPAVSGAIVAIDPNNGAIKALVGGFDFAQSKYNRITQAERQPGSSFKPFIYAAAIDKGFTPASIVNDAPVVFDDPSLETQWRPENYGGQFGGPTRLRDALTHSRNLVSIRVLQAIGVEYAINYATRFGFPAAKLPRNLSLALGSGALTPLELARGHAVLANGGFLVQPYVIERIVDATGNVVMQAVPETVCRSCEGTAPAEADRAADPSTSGAEPVPTPDNPPAAKRVADAATVYLVNSMMMDVVRRGTGRKAMSLGRTDLAGKTGTTNDQRDAWFAGFDTALVAVAWVGFDDPKPLGEGETGGGAALPIWIDFMATALAGTPERVLERPPGLVTVKIDPKTGLLAASGDPDAIFETFPADRVPTQRANGAAGGADASRKLDSATPAAPDQLF